MKLLHKYLNGNVTVSIYDDGTKIQEWSDEEGAKPIYPNSMDIKITNKCDLGCPFCHEMSVPDGEHADLLHLLSILKGLPNGTELALGGGNPLEHPDLTNFLISCHSEGFITNMTINGRHLERSIERINMFIDTKCIYGLGISIDEDFDFSLLDKIKNTSNIVFHVIAGVHNISILDKIMESKVKKVLILGYKEVGRGVEYHDEGVERIKQEWFDHIGDYVGSIHLSFDNLAITQLNVKRLVPQDKWEEFYMGTDGQFTMYIDAVKQECAVSSTSSERFPLEGSIIDIFNKVQVLSGNIENSNIAESE